MSTNRERIIDLVSDQFGVSRDSITPQTHLANDLGADSLDRVELVISIENEFNTQINDDMAERCMTVGSLCDLVSNATA